MTTEITAAPRRRRRRPSAGLHGDPAAAGRNRRLEAEPRACSWFEAAYDLWSGWTFNLLALAVLVLGSTVFLGIPVGLFAEDQSLVDGLIIGALCGTALFGLISIALSALGLIAMVADVVSWAWRRGKRGR